VRPPLGRVGSLRKTWKPKPPCSERRSFHATPCRHRETGLTREFYKPAHGHIYDAITALDRRAQAIDPVTVADELTRSGLLELVGGSLALVTLQSDTPATSNAGRYAASSERWPSYATGRSRRRDRRSGLQPPKRRTRRRRRREAMIFAVGETNLADTVVSVDTLLAEGLDYSTPSTSAATPSPAPPPVLRTRQPPLRAARRRPARPRGPPRRRQILLRARHRPPRRFDRRQPALVFSLEMSRRQITQRLLAAEARVDLAKVRNGRLTESDWPKLSAAVTRMREAPLYLDDKRDVTITELRAKSPPAAQPPRRARSRRGRLRAAHASRGPQREPPNRSSPNIPRPQSPRRRTRRAVVALSQISRNVEQRADKRPTLADLRESGALEADADSSSSSTATNCTTTPAPIEASPK